MIQGFWCYWPLGRSYLILKKILHWLKLLSLTLMQTNRSSKPLAMATLPPLADFSLPNIERSYLYFRLWNHGILAVSPSFSWPKVVSFVSPVYSGPHTFVEANGPATIGGPYYALMDQYSPLNNSELQLRKVRARALWWSLRRVLFVRGKGSCRTMLSRKSERL